MKIVIDSNIPFIKGALEPYADIEYAEGREINRHIIADADAVIIRTRTICNEELLKGSAVKFIGTASIGTDHIDLEWCRTAGIKCASAPGSNAGAVMQYLASSLSYLIMKYGMDPSNTLMGLIGIGNVGSRVARMAETFGFSVLKNDPPRERREGKEGFSSLDELLERSDILSIHVPLTYEGRDKTFRLIDESVLSRLKDSAVLINTSRGPVIEEGSLTRCLKESKLGAAILDVWNNEPFISHELLALTEIGTPHIAGYSVDGKAKASEMIVRELAEYFKLPLKEWKPETLPAPDKPVIRLSEYDGTEPELISRAVRHTYRAEDDSMILKKKPEMFEKLRSDYRIRREFHAYKLTGNKPGTADKLRIMGFK